MNRSRAVTQVRYLGLLCVVYCAFGCSRHVFSGGSRNVVETVRVVSRGNTIAREKTVFVLELRNRRHEVSLDNIDDFLSSDTSTDVNRTVRAEISTKRTKLAATLSEATIASGNRVILSRPNQGRAYSDENVVLYLIGQPGYRIYFSFDEINEIFSAAVKQMQSDLETVVYVHKNHTTDAIEELRERLVELSIGLGEADVSEKDLEALKIQTAAGILERKLRDIGIALTSDKPILRKGLLGRTTSPKLNDALQDSSVVDRIAKSDETDVVRAFFYLLGMNVIKLRP